MKHHPWQAYVRTVPLLPTEKELAHRAVAKAVKEGRLPPLGTCTVCPRRATDRHHPSYDEAAHLVVVPLCRRCHRALHEGRIPDPMTGEIRTGDRQTRGSEGPVSPTVLLKRILATRRLPERATAQNLDRHLWALSFIAFAGLPPDDFRAAGRWWRAVPRTWTDAGLPPLPNPFRPEVP